MTQKLNFAPNANTSLLLGRLLKAKPEEVISYEELSKIISCDVQKDRSPLYSAIRIARDQHNIPFGTITKVGIKRLNDSEALAYAGRSIRKIHMEARRGIKRLRTVKFESLSSPQQNTHNAQAAILSALAEVTTKPKQQKIEGAVAASTNKLSIAETLKHLT